MLKLYAFIDIDNDYCYPTDTDIANTPSRVHTDTDTDGVYTGL